MWLSLCYAMQIHTETEGVVDFPVDLLALASYHEPYLTVLPASHCKRG